MIIKPEHFENGGEVDCCTRPQGRISIRRTVWCEPGEVEAYCHKFTPFKRDAKDVVLKKGPLQEVVAYTNEKCGLEDTVEE